MRINGQKGFTLVELLVTIGIMGMIAGAATSLVSSVLQAHDHGSAGADLCREGVMIMERVTGGVRTCTSLLVPNGHDPTRDVLAFSGKYNDDNDFYFSDPLFPRVDEDPGLDMNGDNKSGIEDVDDNGNGQTDEGGTGDDDEDGLIDEDPLDGLDNDDDGNIDEDFTNDSTNDAKAGIKGMDDDGDGSVDEGLFKDNDEDGSFQEDPLNPVVYLYDSGTGTLREWIPHTGETVELSTHVSSFQVSLEAPARLLITLVLTGDQGESLTFSEHVCPRNVGQKTGKRVR